MDYKLLSLLLILVFIIPNTLAYNISIDLDTQPDQYENRFYISQSTTRQIIFNINSDYLPEEYYNQTKIEYFLKLYPEDGLQNISLELSKNKDNFISEVNSELALNINSNNFKNNLIKVAITATLFDEYNNIINSSSKYITLIANNSLDDFTYTINRAEPRFQGYNFERNKMYLLNSEDTDSISIKEHVAYEYLYDIKCNSNHPAIITKTNYKENQEFDLNISIDINKEIEKGYYEINCYAYNRDNKFDFKPIIVKYFDITYEQEEIQIIEEVIEEVEESTNFLKSLINKIKQFIKKEI